MDWGKGNSLVRKLLPCVSHCSLQFAIRTGTSSGCFGELGNNHESINPLRESAPQVPGRRIRRAPASPRGTAVLLAGKDPGAEQGEEKVNEK